MADKRLQAAMDAIKARGDEIVGGFEDAAHEVEAYVKALEPEVKEIIAAGSQAAATGMDTDTWLQALTAAVDAVILRTLRAADAVAYETEQRLRDVSLTALSVAMTVVLA